MQIYENQLLSLLQPATVTGQSGCGRVSKHMDFFVHTTIMQLVKLQSSRIQ